METKYLGIDVGGTNIKTVILNTEGEVFDRDVIPTEDSSLDPEKWKSNIINLIQEKTEQFADGDAQALRCGISAPGLVGKDNRQILHMPDRLRGLEHFNWTKELDRDIIVINDAHSACLAEYDTFYKNDIKHMILLTLGTGVGGAIIVDGKILQGSIQRAGHLGHLTIDHMGTSTMTNMVGSLEYAVGNFSVEERTNGLFTTTKDLVAAYRQHNALATYWWLMSIQKLATGLASLINILSPELVVVGGGICEAGDDLFIPLDNFMDLYEWRPGNYQTEIKKAQFGGFAGAVGAALFAKQKSK